MTSCLAPTAPATTAVVAAPAAPTVAATTEYPPIGNPASGAKEALRSVVAAAHSSDAEVRPDASLKLPPRVLLFVLIPLALRPLIEILDALTRVALGPQPERIAEVDRIPIGIPVEVEPSGDADGVLLGELPHHAS